MALLLLGILPVATAQEATDTMAAREQKPGLVKQVLERFSKSYGYFDERYVRKPPTKLIVTLRGKVQQTGVSINDFSEFENDWVFPTARRPISNCKSVSAARWASISPIRASGQEEE